MKDKRYYIYLLLIAAVVIFQLMTSKEAPDMQPHDGRELIVDFIDVGQGDAILITTPDGNTMLIDAGDNSQEEHMVSFLHKKGIKKIDFVIGTHPHADHIGGLDAVIRNFDIGEIYMPKIAHTTKTFEDVLIAIKERGHTIKTAKAGVTLDLDKTMNVQMLGPVSNSYTDINDYSAVVKLKYGKMTFLFTGDAEKTSEYEMIEKGYPLDSVVLKVGHHGSDTSTTDEFLEAVNPKYAVISSQKDNKYGHPHKDIIKKLEDNNIIYFDTQRHGTTTAITNGQEIEWITEVKQSN
ncbi:MAG TPA: MBL fold metallo-hydrolase [Epulopiscium sp.]|nr:MBL fold metallo-hydrolase [Candidatus Epulonipiscium sp.]